jgi:hypothetical protein
MGVMEDDPARGQVREALRRLPVVERWLCGRLISRQVERDPRLSRRGQIRARGLREAV